MSANRRQFIGIVLAAIGVSARRVLHPEPLKMKLRMGIGRREFEVPKELIDDLLEDRYGKSRGFN